MQPLPVGPFQAVLRLDRRITREGMVSMDGNQRSAPELTRKRAVEVQVLAGAVRIYEGDALIAVHPVLEGGGRRQIAAGRSRLPPPANSDTPRQGATGAPPFVRLGEAVARRPLEFYEAVGWRLAGQGHSA